MKSESKIQQEIFQWYWNNFCLPNHSPREIILHVPNEGKLQARLVSVGLYAGASDLIVSKNGKIFFVEVKDEKGRQSTNQMKFELNVIQAGFEYILVRSLEDFKNKFV